MKKIYVMGSLNMDMSIRTPTLPQAGETLHGEEFLCNSGGKGANQAVAASLLGGNVVMLGGVGNDLFGAQLKNTLLGFNVDVSNVVTKQCASGVAVVILHNGDNRIILSSGANYCYGIDDYKEVLQKNACKSDLFVAQLETKSENVFEGLKLAKKMGMTTLLNPAPAIKLSAEAYANTDIIVPNLTEARILTEQENISDCLNKFLSLGVKNVIITLGSEGCLAHSGQFTQMIAAHKVETVDTTAAGDTFIGALACRIAKGESFFEACRYANAAAALTVTKRGAQQSMPSESEVENFIKEK